MSIALPDFSVDGIENNWQSRIISVSISSGINKISYAKIILNIAKSRRSSNNSDQDKELIPGKKIEIIFKEKGISHLMFKGIIMRCSIKGNDDGNLELHIESYSEAIKMTMTRKWRYYNDLKDADIFEQLISSYGMQSDSEATDLKHKSLVQYNISDWDFICLRATANAMVISTENGLIKIFRPDTGKMAVANLMYGNNILEFEVMIDGLHQYASVKGRSWDYHNQQVTDVKSDIVPVPADDIAKQLGSPVYQVQHGGSRDQAELQNWTNSIMMRSRLAKITGRAKVTGFAGIKPGDMITLEGVGDQFDGNVFVSGVRHELSGEGWYVDIDFGLSADHFEKMKNGACSINDTFSIIAGSVCGLQIGKVIGLENDPDGENRILINMPFAGATNVWARIARPDAGKGRGFAFLPEIGDEVVVGFINDDPRDPIIIGSLYSSANPPPLKAEDVNHEKGIITRSKMRIFFNDNTKTLTIDSPVGNSIVLDESNQVITIRDQFNNEIEMKAGGIKISGTPNIELKATKVTINGKMY